MGRRQKARMAEGAKHYFQAKKQTVPETSSNVTPVSVTKLQNIDSEFSDSSDDESWADPNESPEPTTYRLWQCGQLAL